MIVVHVEVNLFVFFRTSVDNVIVVLFQDDTDLILGQVRLKLFGLFNPARTRRHTGILVKFLCHARLHQSSVIHYTLVLCIVIEFGFSNHEGSRHA